MSLTGQRFGGYEVHSLLGAGGMGEVYRAHDSRLGRDVALKVLPPAFTADPERLARFEREARVLAALNHPNVGAIHGLEESEGRRALVLELVEGETLAERIQRGPVPLAEALSIAQQITEGLEAAHDKGIVHRDLKPANVKVTASGLVKVLDFGLARAEPGGGHFTVDAPTMPIGGTLEGVIVGTAAYMSPEQARGQVVDKRTDVWAFGCVLYEMLVGRAPFACPTLTDTLAAVIHREPDWAALPDSVPSELARVLRRCLEKDPRRRLRDIGDAGMEIDTVASAPADGLSTIVQPAATAAARRAAPVISSRFLRIALGLAVLLAAATGAFLVGRTVQPSLPRFRQVTFRHGSISGARLAPDGETIIYAATWTGAGPGLYVIRPENPQSGSLGLTNAGIFSISPHGEMAVALGCRLNWGECVGTLAEVPLAGGAPREVMRDVFSADWDGEGRALAVVRVAAGQYRLEYPVGTTLYVAPGWITYARVSPTGDAVAFLDHPTLGDIGGSVALVDASGNATMLSAGWRSLQGLAWSPRGDEIWFTGSRTSKAGNFALHAVTRAGQEREIFSSPGTLKLYDIARDGQQALLLRGTQRSGVVARVPDGAEERELSWFDYTTVADLSADGTTLLFYEWGEGVGGTPTVFLRRTDGSPAVRLGTGRPLALSPDGRWALAVAQTTPPQLILLPTGPGDVRRLPRGSITEYLDWAAWAPDGRRVFFAARGESNNERRTYVQNIDEGEPRAVTPEGFVGAVLSPDGGKVIAFDRYGEYYMLDTTTGEQEPLAGYMDGDTLLQWSSDGRAVFVREANNLVLRIFRLDLAMGRRELWRELTAPAAAELIDVGSDPGQVRLTPDGKGYAYTYWTFAGELYLAEGLR